ncbi:MAG: hypothetical protein PHU27_13400 [Salinivirgaceae bacterium]|nr:hypothetical protein [Salinivirgaceae bacterium]
MNDYIAKPVDEKVLYNKIVSLVAKPQLVKSDDIAVVLESKLEKYINLAYLTERTKSNPVLMSEMIALYLEQTPPLVALMKQSLENKDWDLLKSAVHKMIPSFSIVGIHADFENMAKKIQDIATAKQEGNDLEVLISQLEKVCTQACIELEEELNIMKNNK